MNLFLLIVGFISIAPVTNHKASWAIGATLIFIKFLFDSGVGPVVYSIVSEIPSARVRAYTIVLARIV